RILVDVREFASSPPLERHSQNFEALETLSPGRVSLGKANQINLHALAYESFHCPARPGVGGIMGEQDHCHALATKLGIGAGNLSRIVCLEFGGFRSRRMSHNLVCGQRAKRAFNRWLTAAGALAPRPDGYLFVF